MNDGFSGDKPYEERAWGNFTVVLDEPNVKIKRIVVHSEQRLSLQLHTQREEWWKVISGYGEVQLGDEVISISPRDTITIKKYQVHRVKNNGLNDLIFVEVQTGNCKEDDIIRIEDDYGR